MYMHTHTITHVHAGSTSQSTALLAGVHISSCMNMYTYSFEYVYIFIHTQTHMCMQGARHSLRQYWWGARRACSRRPRCGQRQSHQRNQPPRVEVCPCWSVGGQGVECMGVHVCRVSPIFQVLPRCAKLCLHMEVKSVEL